MITELTLLSLRESLTCFCFLMTRRPPRSTRTDTLFPYTTLFRSVDSSGDSRGKWIARVTGMDGRRIDRVTITPVPAYVEPERSEEHTSELQSLMRISSAVFCLKKKKQEWNSTPLTSIT